MRGAAGTSILVGLLFGLAAPAVAQQPIGDFYLFPRTDPDTGENRSSITTLADENYTSGAGGLTFQCTEDGLSLIVSASHLGRDTSTRVLYRFGEEEPHESVWNVRATGMAAVAPDEERIEFIERSRGQSSVVFYVSDFQLRRHTYTFHLEGMAGALDELACH
jgi:hypothetical protein